MSPIPAWSLLAFALLLTTLSTAQSRTHRHQKSCSSSCGALSNITYPFQLNSDPAECGYGDYELVCEDNQTVLEIGHGKFLVKNISYAENLIRVVDVDLAKDAAEIVHLLINRIPAIVGTLFFYGYLVARCFISPIVLLVFLAYLYATRTKNADMPSLDTQPEAPGLPKEQSNDD